MSKHKKLVLFTVIPYTIIILLLLIHFYKMRSNEYVYSYDFKHFAFDAGDLSEDGSRIYIDESSDYSDAFCASPGTQLRSGDYTITIRYSSDNDNTLHYAAHSNCEKYITLPAGTNEITDSFSVWPASDHFRVWPIYNGTGSLEIDDIIISSDKPLYTDYDFFFICTLIIGVLIPAIIILFIKRFGFERINPAAACILIITGIIVSFPCFYDHIWMGTDTRPHLMRTDGVCFALTDMRLPTVIYSNYCNDYGELSCMYPDKFLYIPGLLRRMGVSLLTAHGTMLFIINISALLIMYFCAGYISGSWKASLISAVIYCCFPYRMYVMYGGGQAFGMGLSLLFFPVLFTALYDIFFQNGNKWYLLAIAMTGLLCSHILSFVYGIILCIITVIFCVPVLIVNNRMAGRIGHILFSLTKAAVTFAILGLSTLVPFVYYSKGLNLGRMELDFLKSIPPLQNSLLSGNGIYHIILFVICSVLLLRSYRNRIKDKPVSEKDVFCIFLLAAGFLLFVMSTKLFPWKPFAKWPFIYSKLGMFQFAERFMLGGISAIGLGSAVLFSKLKKERLMIALGLICLTLGCYTAYRQISLCGTCVFDHMTGNIYYRQLGYLPQGSEEDFYVSNVPNCGDWDSVDNISYIKNGTSIHYEYTCGSDGNYMEFPLFYYRGYHAYDASGNELTIKKSDHNRITLDLIKSTEPQVIDIEFKMHPIFRISAVISLIGTVSLYLYIIRLRSSSIT